MKLTGARALAPFGVLLVGGLAVILYLDALTEAVIVDGKRKGPSALVNQSHENELAGKYNTKTCGLADPDSTKSLFVNSAKEGEFPWLVSFQICKPDCQHFCMGSFISDKWVLTAAHCFTDEHIKLFLNDDKIKAIAGSVDNHNPKNHIFTPERIYYHSQFDPASPVGFDIALVELEERASLSRSRPANNEGPFINTVCLPLEGKEFKKGQAVRLAGWGDTESMAHDTKPDRLLATDLLITDAEECAEIFSKKVEKIKKQYHEHKDFICAEYNGTRDACQGDSGGPLLEYADDKAVIVGIVSFGLGCATSGVPGVYTRTSSFIPWIKDITLYGEKATVHYTLVKKE